MRSSVTVTRNTRRGCQASWVSALSQVSACWKSAAGWERIVLQFARGGARVTGVDLTPRSIETSRHHLKLYGQSGDFALTDAEHLPFADESFDVVYSNGVLHHTPDTAEAVREVYRLLRPGGLARVMLYHRNSWYYWFEIMLHRGLLRGQLLRGQTAEEIMSRYVEVNEAKAGRW